MAKDTVDMIKWMERASAMMNEAETTPEEEKQKERDKAREKLHADLGKTNRDLMSMKTDKLNMLIKKKYYDSGKDVDEADMFQFHFSETSKGYEFQIPLNILFGRRTQAFCAQYWDDFFNQAGIDVSFSDNIYAALQKAGNINLVMTLDKDFEDEIEKDGHDDKVEDENDDTDDESKSVDDVFDEASSDSFDTSDESFVNDEFDLGDEE